MATDEGSPPPAADVALSRGHAWALTLVATFTMAVSYVDRQTLAVLAPTVTAALQISDATYGWLASTFSLAYLIATPLAGRWVDAVGARRGLLVAVISWSLVAASHALVTGASALFVARIALGIAESPSFPGASQTIGRVLAAGERPRAFGVLFTGSSIGAIAAPLLATWMQRHYGFRGAFVGTALVGLAWVPLWLAVTRSGAAKRALDLDEEQATRPSWRSVIGHDAVLRSATVIFFAASPISAFVLLWGAKYLVAVHRLGELDVAPYLIGPPLAFDVGALVFGDLATRRARRRLAAAHVDPTDERGLLVVAALLVAIVGLLPFVRTAAAAMGILGAAMAGSGGVFAIAVARAMTRTPKAAHASVGGILAAAQSLAYVVVSPLIGHVVEARHSYAMVAYALAIFALPACASWLSAARARA